MFGVMIIIGEESVPSGMFTSTGLSVGGIRKAGF